MWQSQWKAMEKEQWMRKAKVHTLLGQRVGWYLGLMSCAPQALIHTAWDGMKEGRLGAWTWAG